VRGMCIPLAQRCTDGMKRQTSLHAGRLAQWSEGQTRRGKLHEMYARGRVRSPRAAAGQM